MKEVYEFLRKLKKDIPIECAIHITTFEDTLIVRVRTRAKLGQKIYGFDEVIKAEELNYAEIIELPPHENRGAHGEINP